MDEQKFIEHLHADRVKIIEMRIKSLRTQILYLHIMFLLGAISAILMLYAGNKKNLTFVIFVAGMLSNNLISQAGEIFNARKSLRYFMRKYKEMRMGNDWKPFIPDNLEN